MPMRMAVTRVVVRTMLLATAIALLFPAALDGLARGAWARMVLALGAWRWVAWGACFAAMTLMRFAGGPKRS
jgi:hypothetical protein